MKVAITGGSGQLGTLILRRLIDDRSVKSIVALDVRPPMLVSGKLTYVKADVREPDIGRHFEGCDALVHLAFIVTTHAKREVVEAVNVGGSKNVFSAAVAAGVKTIVYSSSVAAYGVLPGHPVPLVEDSPRRLNAGFAYSATKYQVEEFLDGFEREHPDVSIARLRPAILVGMRMEHALGEALRRRRLAVIGAKTEAGAPMPLVWDEDVADAAMLALKQRARGAFNLSADDSHPVGELARAAGMGVIRIPRALAIAVTTVQARLAEHGVGRGSDPAWIENQGAVMVMSCARAKAELGWKPRCPKAIDVLKRFDEVVPERTDSRLAFFLRAVDLAGRFGPPIDSMVGISAVVHLALTGRNGGDYTVTARDCRVRVKRGIPRPPTSTLTMPANQLLEMLAGKGDLMVAQMTGSVRIDGAPVAAMLVGGMVSTFRARTRSARGPIARSIGKWLGGTSGDSREKRDQRVPSDGARNANEGDNP